MEANSERLNPVWLNGPLRGLLESLNNAGFEAFAVGGCVRDAVMDRKCNDIDVATDAHPQSVKNVLKADGWRMVPTGIEHGTWTAIKDHHTFEVTTYRLDVETDGRRATIQFAETMEEDAARRDFTMNALYMDLNGEVYDPTGTGVADAKAGLIRFVGDAATRCCEDYLRILRFYRFFITHGKVQMDPTAKAACEEYAAGLHDISNERVLMELRKILEAPDRSGVFHTLYNMHAGGVLDEIIRDADMDGLRALLTFEDDKDLKTDWRTRLYVLAGKNVHLPLSKKDRMFIETLATLISNPPDLSLRAIAWVHGFELARELGFVRGDDFYGKDLVVAASQEFPVTSEDFMDLGFTQGQELGKALRQAKEFWLKSEMTATKEASIAHVMEGRT